MAHFYFSSFEKRSPPAPLKTSRAIEFLWQILAVAALLVGANYIRWRWMASLNYDALWYAVPLVIAETLAYCGTILFTINLWQVRDVKRRPPPRDIRQCLDSDEAIAPRPVKVDLFIATYSEDTELVRLSIQDAKRVTYPFPLDYRIHVLDDGKRPEMRRVAEQEGVNYLSRENNIGFKAGNLRNGLEHTDGDFIVICDADTRVFPSILTDTLGYFRDPLVAWVQTPQWFYDLPAGKLLPHWLKDKLGQPGYVVGRAFEGVVGPLTVGQDPFFNDPKMFYDVILRRRNAANAAFCCGAASIHRREAIMQSALRSYARAVENEIDRYTRDVTDAGLRDDLGRAMKPQIAFDTELTPYKFHVSEDIYTSIVLHGDPERRWRSVMHPEVESKMLSPQDLLTWMIQRFKYAAGSLDIALHDAVFSAKNFRLSLAQKLMYGTTFWSYLACLWNTVFLISPLIYLFTGIPPVSAYSLPFYLHFLPFFLLSELAFMFGTWGISAWDGKASYLSLFSMNLRALDTVLRGEKIKFHVTPKERQQGNFLTLVKPQLAIIALTLLGLLWGGAQLYLGKVDDPAGYVINIFWGGVNVMAMLPMVFAALWRPESEPPSEQQEAG
ncbi:MULTISPECIES: glycosyltransferase family 2 protein [Serratia]|uniref:glycosyltransferase family 2 protein n=1 Tax=Serratia TaxID=613 RepID=UPI0018DA3042|nr:MULTISPECIES: cellulose synthase catalytic subunit [Serratia]MBH2663574.1 glycosyltransferase [Serratia ureilytica]MBH3106962.1 glycosyltransferase [Serratia ureilytica]MBH3121779.1 glycosyltransferase [Serratia ureilytica]MBH3155556.1 glycosyltransferase [Serratia ureilytica]MBH3250648.1 glycosyltransferase [Serratia ureilytica]